MANASDVGPVAVVAFATRLGPTKHIYSVLPSVAIEFLTLKRQQKDNRVLSDDELIEINTSLLKKS